GRRSPSLGRQLRMARDEFLRDAARAGRGPAVGQGPGAAGAAELAAASATTPVTGCVRQVYILAGLTCLAEDQVLRVARACSGNLSGDCVRVACSSLGAAECSGPDRILEIVTACRADYSGDCLATVCRLVGLATCSSRPNVLRLIEACAGNLGG